LAGIPLKIAVSITPGNIDSVTLKIYTAGYRLIRQQVFEGTDAQAIADNGFLQYDYSNLIDLSEGLYYYFITAGKGGVTARSRTGTLIILK